MTIWLGFHRRMARRLRPSIAAFVVAEFKTVGVTSPIVGEGERLFFGQRDGKPCIALCCRLKRPAQAR